jgi:REP-associated tyrosine transposase
MMCGADLSGPRLGHCPISVVTLRRPRRIEGFSYRGPYQYLLTFCTANRIRQFERAELVATARSRIQQTSVEENFSIVAYGFMPDHLHLVVEGLSDDADLRRFVKIGKQRVVYSLRENHRVRNIWQEGFHDWVLRSEQSIEDAQYLADLKGPPRLQVGSSFEHEFGPAGLVNPVLAPFNALRAAACDDVDLARGATMGRGGNRRGRRAGP